MDSWTGPSGGRLRPGGRTCPPWSGARCPRGGGTRGPGTRHSASGRCSPCPPPEAAHFGTFQLKQYKAILKDTSTNILT